MIEQTEFEEIPVKSTSIIEKQWWSRLWGAGDNWSSKNGWVYLEMVSGKERMIKKRRKKLNPEQLL